jgi:hypothetical protein
MALFVIYTLCWVSIILIFTFSLRVRLSKTRFVVKLLLALLYLFVVGFIVPFFILSSQRLQQYYYNLATDNYEELIFLTSKLEPDDETQPFRGDRIDIRTGYVPIKVESYGIISSDDYCIKYRGNIVKNSYRLIVQNYTYFMIPDTYSIATCNNEIVETNIIPK